MKWVIEKDYDAEGAVFYTARVKEAKDVGDVETWEKAYKRVKRTDMQCLLNNYFAGENYFEVEIARDYNDITEEEAINVLKALTEEYKRIKSESRQVKEVIID